MRKLSPSVLARPNVAEELFDLVLSLGIDDLGSNESFKSLRQRALSNKHGWKQEFRYFLHGLSAAREIPTQKLREIDNKLAQRSDTELSGAKVFTAIFWIFWLPFVAMLCTMLVVSTSTKIVVVLVTSIASALWISQRDSLRPSGPLVGKLRWERPLMMIGCAILTPILVLLAGLLAEQGLRLKTIRDFNVGRRAFEHDPAGFPFVRSYAKENFGIDVILGGANDSWALTTLDIPQASVASMEALQGYCELNINKNDFSQGFSPVRHVPEDLWLRGVTMHEFGHCLDMRRDQPTFGDPTIRMASVAPVDKPKIHDIQSYFDTGETLQTQLWREAFADIFATGYWRQSNPTQARDLIDALKLSREAARVRDPAHATMCWIDAADQSPIPATARQLFEWTDRIRATAHCVLPRSK